MTRTPFPLSWPLSQLRTRSRKESDFRVDFETAYSDLVTELERFGASGDVISSNVPIRSGEGEYGGLPDVRKTRVADPGVAVYFERGGRPFVIACDTFVDVRSNLRAVWRAVRAFRDLERDGCSAMVEQAMGGFRELPAKEQVLEGEVVDAPVLRLAGRVG
jgi:hypothetical protein